MIKEVYSLYLGHYGLHNILDYKIYVLQYNAFSHAFVEDQRISTKDLFSFLYLVSKLFSWVLVFPFWSETRDLDLSEKSETELKSIHF